jgi:molybdate/tungstate transport system substrate-binding protein
MKRIALVCLLMSLLAGVTACATSSPSTGTASGKTKLVVFEADSLMVPFAEIKKEFEQANPDIQVQMQAHGSIQVIRQVTELGQDVDVVAVADYSLIPMLMYQTKMPDGKPYASWDIMPATNQLVLAYTTKSKYAGELSAANWYQIISRPDVRFGFADPRMDAVGYRNLMALKLAETYYHANNIMDNTVGKYFSMPITSNDINGASTVHIPELLEPTDPHMVLRGAHMELLALLQSGDIDYTIDYKSTVIQDGLQYLELPPEINLADKNFAQNYGKVVVKTDYQRFKTVDPVFQGLPIIYGMTIANNSTHQAAAEKFVQFVLSADGQRIFKDSNQPELIPPQCDNINALPDSLKPLFR